MLEFAIENRKRVKDQLRKMDETFERVDFSYINKSTQKKTFVQTLEYIEYKELLGLADEEAIPEIVQPTPKKE